jgi:hypothetical protein
MFVCTDISTSAFKLEAYNQASREGSIIEQADDTWDYTVMLHGNNGRYQNAKL